MSKFKRMAVKAKRSTDKSKKYPKYWKYEFDIQEIDGKITKGVPAYGVDMEDALASVELIEKRNWVLRFFNKIPQWLAFIMVGVVMSAAALLSEAFHTPSWVIGILGAIGILGGVIYYVNGRIESRMINSNE